MTYGAGPAVSAKAGVSESRTGMQLQGKNGKKGSVNYYAAARERQREWELRRGERAEEQSGSGKGKRMAKGGRPAGGVLGGLLGGGAWE